uniref:Armadillo-type protein n=1 Tax=Heterorhabditis bacteriophora TaxID=37862 RepID=A0A1I7WX81_HETBA
MSVTIQDTRATPRHIVEQLRKFVQLADAPPSANGSSLSETGFVLLTLKDQILAETPRSLNFCQEFISRPLNGIELLGKVVIVLQNIVNSSQGASTKISSLLSRNNSNTNRKRKAAVAEADCIECIKILLEKSDVAWRSFLDSATGLDAVLYSVHSPQLDSKCYALEILLLLLDQPQGFIILFRALTTLSAKNRDFLRLSIFVAQLKHGLHTSKLHIQILVVRLFNKLLASAPTPIHRSLVKAEATLAQFSVEYVEKLIAAPQIQFGGVDVLMEELNVWKSFGSQSLVSYGNTIEHNHIYGLSETESDTAQNDRTRRIKAPVTKHSMASQYQIPIFIERWYLKNTKIVNMIVLIMSFRGIQLLLKMLNDSDSKNKVWVLAEERQRRLTIQIIVDATQLHIWTDVLLYLTKDGLLIQHSVPQSPSTPTYAGAQSISRVLSPSPLPQPDYETRSPYSESGQIVYIPINMDSGRRLSKSTRYERRDNDYFVDSRSNSRSKQRSPSINGTMGEDVRDALSQFDYLNDYDNSSPREKEKDLSYHF